MDWQEELLRKNALSAARDDFDTTCEGEKIDVDKVIKRAELYMKFLFKGT